jgi:branched-chain amino acid aminotransferase
MVRLIESLDFDELRIRLVLDLSDKPGTLYLLALPLQTPSLEVYSRGVRVAITEINRLTPQLKRTTFISETSKERDEKGADEYEILLTHNRLIREGMTSNFFYVRGRRLYTAGRDVLKGVTRRTVIALARSAGMIVSYNALTLDAIPSIEEAFITSSSRGIVPVVQIGDQWVGEGRVGPVTRQLSMEYETRVLEMAEVIA